MKKFFCTVVIKGNKAKFLEVKRNRCISNIRASDNLGMTKLRRQIEASLTSSFNSLEWSFERNIENESGHKLFLYFWTNSILY